MTLSKEQKKKAIMAKMLMGGDAEEVAEEYTVSSAIIVKWMRDHSRTVNKDDILNLKSVDPIALELVGEAVKRKAADSPTITSKQLNSLEAGVDGVVKGVVGLQLLEDKFHKLILKLLTWADNKITDDMKISEWATLVDKITILHTSLFKTSNTSINMLQQNNGGGTSSAKVDRFKAGYRL